MEKHLNFNESVILIVIKLTTQNFIFFPVVFKVNGVNWKQNFIIRIWHPTRPVSLIHVILIRGESLFLRICSVHYLLSIFHSGFRRDILGCFLLYFMLSITLQNWGNWNMVFGNRHKYSDEHLCYFAVVLLRVCSKLHHRGNSYYSTFEGTVWVK